MEAMHVKPLDPSSKRSQYDNTENSNSRSGYTGAMQCTIHLSTEIAQPEFLFVFFNAKRHL